MEVTLLELADEIERLEEAGTPQKIPPSATGALRSLVDLTCRLERDGVEVVELRALQVELEVISRPPGLVTRLSVKASEVIRGQWGHFVGELQESREAMSLIGARVRGERSLTAEERDKIRSQLMDLVRVFPAGLIAAVNTAIPMPGTSWFTPWILVKLGLMPSRWREAHLLARLRRQQEALRARGREAAARQLGELARQIEHAAEAREAIKTECRVLTHWDSNQNGVWDPEEREAYREELQRLRKLIPRHGSRKSWYLEHVGEVYGAYRLSEIDVRRCAEMLICFDGRSGWVAVSDLLADDDGLDTTVSAVMPVQPEFEDA